MKKVVRTILIIILMMTIAGVTFATTGTIQTNSLNLRESASTTGNVITSLNNGTLVNIIDESGNWYKVSYQNYTGYVSKDYVSKNTDTTATVENSEVTNDNVTSTTSSINEAKTIVDTQVYILPLINSTKLSKLNSGADVKVISTTSKWAYIQDDEVSGWVSINKLNITQSNSTAISNYTNSDEITNQSENTESGTIITNTASTNENSSNDSVSNTNNLTTTTIVENTSSELTTSETSNYPKTMYVNVDAVFIRTSASKTAEILNSATLNSAITVTGKSGDWYKVKVNGDNGYILSQYLSTSKK